MVASYVVFLLNSGTPLVGEGKQLNIVDPFCTGALDPRAFFEIEDWSLDVEQTLNIGSQASGAGAGKITFNPFAITRKIDRALPILFHDAAAGTPFEFVDLMQRRSGTSGAAASFSPGASAWSRSRRWAGASTTAHPKSKSPSSTEA